MQASHGEEDRSPGIRFTTHRRGDITFRLATTSTDPDAYHQAVQDGGAWTELNVCLRALVKPGDTVIDAGANIGTVAIPLAASGVGVIAYEPLAGNIRFLNAAVTDNNMQDRVTVRDVALWDRRDTLPFSGTSAWARADDEGRYRAQATTIDDDLPAGAAVRAVKLDVEGAELHALRGMRRLIADQHPDIVFEANGLTLGWLGSSIAEVIDLLTASGYRIYRIYEARRLLDPSGIPPETASTDYLATTRPPMALRLQTGHRVGRMRPRHILRRILAQNDDWWPDHLQVLAAADRLPRAVWRNPEAADRLARWRKRYADHPLLDTVRSGNFGTAGTPR